MLSSESLFIDVFALITDADVSVRVVKPIVVFVAVGELDGV